MSVDSGFAGIKLIGNVVRSFNDAERVTRETNCCASWQRSFQDRSIESRPKFVIPRNDS